MPDLSKIENEINDRYELFRGSFPEQADMNVDNFINTALRHIAHTPSLQDCSIKSIVHELRFAAQLGLYVGEEYRQAFLDSRYIPEGEQTVAKLIPGFQGHIKLAQRDGNVETIRPRAVYEDDVFRRYHGTRENEQVYHRPFDEGDRGELWKAYAVFTFDDSETEVAAVIDAERVERIKEALGGTAASAWEDEVWEEDMWKKTAIIYGCKYVITDNEASRALNRFAGNEFGDSMDGIVDQRDTPERAEEALGLTDTEPEGDEPFSADDSSADETDDDSEPEPDRTDEVVPDDKSAAPDEEAAPDAEADIDEDIDLDDIEGLDQGIDDLDSGDSPDTTPEPSTEPEQQSEPPSVETLVERLSPLLTEEFIEDSPYEGEPTDVAETIIETTLDKRFGGSEEALKRARIGMNAYFQAVRSGRQTLSLDEGTLPVYDREDE